MYDSATGPAPHVRIGDGSELTRALFVRDRFALASAASVPALDPPVVARPTSGVPDTAWDKWWAALLTRAPLTPLRPFDPGLAALASEVDEEARRWEEEHVTCGPADHLMWISDWLGTHRLRAHVDVLVIGAGGSWSRRIGPGRALVSTALYRDPIGIGVVVRELLDEDRATPRGR